MGLGERENNCIKYINNFLEKPLKEGTLEFRTWKSCVDIRDIDIFHQVAQSLGQKELKRSGDLFYFISVPRYEGDKIGTPWDVSLVGGNSRSFIEKYDSHYEITRI